MSKAQNNFNILIQVQSQNEAERIISLFRGAGIATRAHRVTSEEDFSENIKSSDWDLLVVDNRHPQVTLAFSLDLIKKANIDTPVLLISEDVSNETLERAFKQGIQDVVLKTGDTHFIHAAKREMANFRQRAKAKVLEKDFAELSSRAEKLLAESDDAIAYVADGIIMKLNDAFAKAFGYTPEQLDCASIIDLVSEEDHKRFKNFFKVFAKGEMEQTDLVFQALKKDGEKFEAYMSIANSTLDDEPCLQLTIGSSASANSVNGSGTLDQATELYNRYYLADQIVSTAMQATNGVFNASLLTYALDNFDDLLGDVSLSGIDFLIKDLASHLHGQLNSGEIIARLGIDTIVVILQQAPEAALKVATESLKTIEKHICELNGRTLQYTCTCAVLHLNSKNATQLLDYCLTGITSLREQQAKNSADIFTPKAKEVTTSAHHDAVSNVDEAIALGTLKLFYQPMMSLQGDEHENYESTVWMEEGGKNIYPTELIKGAKNSKLDRWIILETTKTLSLHRAGGHNTRLTINLTSNALLDEALPAWLKVAIKAANLTSDLLTFQFSEEDVRNNLKAAIKCFNALRDASFTVSIGNFAKDSEPFKITSHVKLDFVKIDQKYTALIGKGDTAELKQIMTKAKELGIKTTVSEVDNAGALATLWQLGTHYIQGSYLQGPSPVMNYEFTEIA